MSARPGLGQSTNQLGHNGAWRYVGVLCGVWNFRSYIVEMPNSRQLLFLLPAVICAVKPQQTMVPEIATWSQLAMNTHISCFVGSSLLYDVALSVIQYSQNLFPVISLLQSLQVATTSTGSYQNLSGKSNVINNHTVGSV